MYTDADDGQIHVAYQHGSTFKTTLFLDSMLV
jgi:hypothetical protein